MHTVVEVEVDADSPVGRLQIAVVRYKLNRHGANLILWDHVEVVHHEQGAVPEVYLPDRATSSHLEPCRVPLSVVERC